MLRSIIKFSLRFRGTVAVLAVALVAYGLYVSWHARLDVFPEFASPMITIQTEAPGLAPEQVEQLVTRQIENAVNGVPRLQALRSQSIQGLSVVTIVFKEDADIYRARQVVSERLNQLAGNLPMGVAAPKMGALTSSTSSVLLIGLTSTNRSPMELRTFVDWTLKPRLLGVPGVAKVDIFGGEIRQLQVQVKQDRMHALGVGFDEVLAATRKATGILGSGFVENASDRVQIRVEGQSVSPTVLGQVALVAGTGQGVRLSDVADIVEAAEPKTGDAQINGENGVTLLASSQYQANTMEVTAALERALEEMKPLFQSEKIQLHPKLFRPANFIETSLSNIAGSLIIGGALVAVVLLFFLLDLRIALISFVSIPLSLLAAVLVLDRFGLSVNTLTLGGFAIAIGVVVDDAIIDVENILRRLRENASSSRPRSLFRVIFDASFEVRSAVVFATFIDALVFVPVLSMTGVQGKLFAPLALSFVLSVLASLVVALTVTPALCYLLLSRAKARVEPVYVRWLKQRHNGWLQAASRKPGKIIAIAVLLCVAAVATLPFFGGEFLPEFREGNFILHIATLPGSSLQENLRIGREVTRELLKNPHVRSVAQNAGRSELGDDTWGPHYSEIYIGLKDMGGEEAEGVAGEIRQAVLKFPGISFRLLPFLAERIEETLSGATAQFVVNVFGDDFGVLDSTASAIASRLSQVPGAVDVQMETQPGVQETIARLRPDRVFQFGFRPVEVLETIQAAYQGATVAQIYENNRVEDVVVLLHPKERLNPESLGELKLQNKQGLRVPLKELADIGCQNVRYAVSHENAKRRQQVTCNIAGGDAAEFARKAMRAIESKVRLPAGVYFTYGGSALAQGEARTELLVHSGIAATGIVLLLGMVFGTGRNLLLILANLPFALAGGALAVFGTGGLLSIGSLVGFVTLFGITVRNSIMMISHFNHLVQVEGQPWGLETAIRGASERLAPILMTALVTGFGLLPLALGTGEAGREIEGPMAIVILGGLMTSTALNLLVLPTMAVRWGKFEAGKG